MVKVKYYVTPLCQDWKMMKRLIKPAHGSLEWLNQRWKVDGKVVFGASDAPTLMGVSPYNSRADLYLNKLTFPEMKEATAAMRRGNLLEPAVLQFASEELGIALVTPDYQYQEGRFVVSLDGVDDAENPSINVEVKSTAKYNISDSDDLPPEWRWQGWAQQLVTKCPVVFATLDRRQSLSLVSLPAVDDAFKRLTDEAEWFADIVENEKGIDAFTDELDSDQIAKMYLSVAGSVELDAEALLYLNILAVARDAKNTAEKQEKEAKDILARLLKSADIGTIDGVPVVSWKQSAGRDSLDTKRLKEEHPALVAEFMKQGQPYRTMRILQTKGEDE